MNTSQAVVKRILDLCAQREITVNALSNLSGVTQSTVSDIVNGITYSTGISTIKKICDGLDISLREFFNSDIFDDLEPEIK